MFKKKEQTKLRNRSVAFFFVGVLLLSVIALGLNARVQTEKSVAVTPSETKQQIDNENDGMYTNDIYGFSFEYPKETFPIQTYYDWGVRFSSYEISSNDQTNLGKDIFLLSFSTYGDKAEHLNLESQIKKFEFEYGKSKGAKLEGYKSSAIKIRNLDNGLYNGYLVKITTENGLESSGNQYQAVWKKDDILYYLSLSTTSKTTLKNSETMFETILSTVKFF